jgi:predicted Zn-dependent protease with MMP-like domain
MTRKEFETIVAEEAEKIPERFRKELSNVVFIAEDEPSAEELRENKVPEGETLLGLFHGVTLGERGSGPWELPGRIVIFRQPSEDEAEETRTSVRTVVHDTIWHEVAHYLGMEEGEVERAEERRKKK